jgi:hypothetical protein
MMANPTEAQYAAAIPDCCQLQTYEQHAEMMLCWSLAHRLREGKPVTPDMCGACPLRKGGEW